MLGAYTSELLAVNRYGPEPSSDLPSPPGDRGTREIGLRAALGASPRHLLAGILGRAMMLVGTGAGAGGTLLLMFIAQGAGPTGRPGEDVVTFLAWLGVTSVVMLAAGVVACLQPARRALRINPSEALEDA